MSLLSVILPARNERYLETTICSLRSSCNNDIEIIVVLDGETDYHDNIDADKIIYNPIPEGIRHSINAAVEESHGDCLLKLDAHCIVGESFDKIIKQDYQENSIVVARRYTLDLESMKPIPRIVDYFYLSCPWTYPRGFHFMQSCPWISRTEERMDTSIDELMCFQGSMWFMSRNHWDWLGGLRDDLSFAEHHELSMKTWLMGGNVIINKNTWYAHPRERVSGYRMDMNVVYRDHEKSADYWIDAKFAHDFGWLIDKFWPLPTASKHHRLEKYHWPEDWRKYYEQS